MKYPDNLSKTSCDTFNVQLKTVWHEVKLYKEALNLQFSTVNC